MWEAFAGACPRRMVFPYPCPAVFNLPLPPAMLVPQVSVLNGPSLAQSFPNGAFIPPGENHFEKKPLFMALADAKKNKTMTQKKNLILIFTLILFLSGCDQVEAPYNENPGNRCGDALGPVKIRRILLEDFTGHLCGNCPQGHEKIFALKSVYCDHLIPISIHSGNLTEVLNDTGMYSYNWVTPAADSIREEFQVNSKPQGLVNRSGYDGSRVLSVSKWDAALDAQWQKPVEAELLIESQFNQAEGTVNATVEMDFFVGFNEPVSLSLYVIEDSIVKWQKNYFTDPSDIEFYMHRHVFRASVGGVFGKKIADEVSAGAHFSRSFSFTLHPDWNPSHISLVAFVSKINNKEIIQAADHELSH